MCIVLPKVRKLLESSTGQTPLAMDTLRERLAAQNSTATYKATKFEIPALKTMGSSSTASATKNLKVQGGSTEMVGVTTATVPSKLNEFLLAQLNEKRNNAVISTSGFTLPTLQQGGNIMSRVNSGNGANQFVIPLLQNSTNHLSKPTANVATLRNGLQNLKVMEESAEEKPTIDLTTALSFSNVHSSTSANRLEARSKTQVEDFHIPFIECDRSYLLPTANDYCQTDISNSKLNHCLMRPSSCGRILCLHYASTKPLPRINHSFKENHKIELFRFDTMSPDDKVLATLGKYKRLEK